LGKRRLHSRGYDDIKVLEREAKGGGSEEGLLALLLSRECSQETPLSMKKELLDQDPEPTINAMIWSCEGE